jgi:hypothetical protein
MTQTLPARKPRWPLLLILLLFHGVVFMALSYQKHYTQRELASLELRILPPQAQPAPPPKPRPQTAATAPTPSHVVVPVPDVQVTAPAPTPTIAAVAAAPASAASAPQKLNLALPLRMQAAAPTAKELTSHDLHDGQPNRKSVEYRVADAAGTLPIETSTTTDGLGSTMVRQGSKCTKIVANRLSTVDPFDSRAKLPPTSGDCFKK